MNTTEGPAEADPWKTCAETTPLLAASATEHPQQIGRYRIEKILGEGGFGRVFLAHDDQLNRPVAIKIPRRERISRPEDADAYLAEARAVASLDHPNIVPVYDVGSADGLCFVVSKLIDGSDLAVRIQRTTISLVQAVGWIATAAEALHHAHRKGLVHRDIKPANIFLDMSDTLYVADFGLALKEEDFGKGAGFAGTPAYMSPEQARGEGHRVDGRSDIFSLGVVFYEMLVGKLPFKTDSVPELLEQITSVEIRPPRQVDDRIPKELERICLKALSKRASERYTTARDMADDLRYFLASAPKLDAQLDERGSAREQAASRVENASYHGAASTPAPGPAHTLDAQLDKKGPSSETRLLKIVPKGLRSFDARDADFFLELLPGPRDRDGLPDSIRFWKTRIEEADADNTFAVGLIYGPSGCGKSSLVKAGLLPRLSENVLAVYVEATADDTETRLLKGLRKQCPGLPETAGVVDTLAELRRGHFLPAGKKVVLVLDQFEQWLHAKKEQQGTELVKALRQCDGTRVQSIVMVRDDFWMAATRFMRELEVPLLEGHNSAAVDLFPIRHAEKVLAALGRAFGVLPEVASPSSEQKQFIEQAVAGLAQEGKVISVRLALFAEMMKGKPWTPATLKAAGGTEGIGVAFLEETFSAAYAPPQNRYHQKAARAVLKSLLPEFGTDIKGHMRSHDELLAASGYASRARDFDDLIRILDSEIRLITPTDPEGKDAGQADSSQVPRQPGTRPEKADLEGAAGEPPALRRDAAATVQASVKYYQLTHDYLVPSLRDWLTRKQKETRRGRAELLLADRASVWNARPENRQLPSLWQWLSILWLTQKKNWTPPQRKMMRQARRCHALRGLLAAACLCAVALGGFAIRDRVVEQNQATRAAGLVHGLLDADTAQVPGIIDQLTEYRGWADPLLKEEFDRQPDDSPGKFHVGLALLRQDPGYLDYVFDQMLQSSPQEIWSLRKELLPHREELQPRLWKMANSTDKKHRHDTLSATCILACLSLGNEEDWHKISALVVERVLVSIQKNPRHYPVLLKIFQPVSAHLLAPLSVVFRSQDRSDSERSFATNLLAEYAQDNPAVLADLLMDADERQFAVFYPRVKEHGKRGLHALEGELSKKVAAETVLIRQEKLAKRQANAAVALLRMHRPEKVWRLLKHSADPRGRSYLMDRFAPLGADAGALIKRLDVEPDLTSRRALILSLGDFDVEKLTPDARKSLLPKLEQIYGHDPDPGLHAACEWLLRTWQQQPTLNRMNDEWAKDREQQARKVKEIKQSLTKAKAKAPPQWFVNGQGQTMVVIPGPVEFLMGSPAAEAGRYDLENQHKERIGWSFVIAAKSVTLEQYRKFDKNHKFTQRYAPAPDCPAVSISWHQAAAYCNWLSEKEGIDPQQCCYEIKGQLATLKENHLKLPGYRLPTEAEMEFATRADALTSRCFGETEELLPRYAWYQKNSQEQTWPVGSLKPNDFGLFDVHGNVYTWCHPMGKGVEEFEDPDSRVLRGGSFADPASSSRSAYRLVTVSADRYVDHGFRVARTFAP